MINYENEVAVKCGINAAVIADYLWNLTRNKQEIPHLLKVVG